MERTDKEIIEAMTFIKEQHNGELPYKFGTFECAKMMAKYLKQQLLIKPVVQQRELLFCKCGLLKGGMFNCMRTDCDSIDINTK